MSAVVKVAVLFAVIFPVLVAWSNRKNALRVANEFAELISKAHKEEAFPRYSHWDLSHIPQDMWCAPLDAEQLQHIRACDVHDRYDVTCAVHEAKCTLFTRYVIFRISIDFSGCRVDADGQLCDPYSIAMHDCLVRISYPGGIVQAPEVIQK